MHYILRVAWQDSRASRAKLFLLLSSLVIGIATLVFALLMRSSFEVNIDREAKALLGADLSVRARSELSEELLRQFKPKRITREIQFRSMAQFSGENLLQKARLVQVRALSGAYPFYGQVSTNPPGLWPLLIKSENDALVDRALLIQLDIKIGESLKLADKSFIIRGAIEKFPGSLSISGAVAPQVYISHQALLGSKLLGKLSIVEHYLYAELQDELTVAELKQFRDSKPSEVRIETVSDRRERLGRVNQQLGLFLGLVAVCCILLGGVGAAIALFFFLRTKIKTIALLRCIGVSGYLALLVVLLQLIAAALVALCVGILTGVVAHDLVLDFLSTRLNLDLIATPVSGSLLSALAIGVLVVLFAAAPGLILLKQMRALDLLRTVRINLKNRFLYLWLVLVLLAPFLLLWLIGVKGQQLLISVALIDGALVLLLGVVFVVLKFLDFALARLSLRFELKHALRRIVRNRASSVLLIGSLSFSAMLFTTVLIARASLIGNVDKVRSENSANLFIYDLGAEDITPVQDLLEEFELKISEDVPIILMRIQKINGREVSSILADQASKVPAWTLRREYWSTYRSELISNEEIVAGDWVAESNGQEPIAISIEDRLAGHLGVGLGDQIEFSIQGAALRTYVASVRKIYWEQMRRNAFIVFPKGTIAEAESFRFLTLHVRDAEQSAKLQRAMAERFPSISVIDLRQAVETVFSLLDQILLAITFLVSVVALTVLVLVLIMLFSAKVAVKNENALLATLGTKSIQQRAIFFIEQGMLAVIALVIALPIMFGASLLASHFLKRTDIVFPYNEVGVFGLYFILIILTLAALFDLLTFSKGDNRSLCTQLRNE